MFDKITKVLFEIHNTAILFHRTFISFRRHCLCVCAHPSQAASCVRFRMLCIVIEYGRGQSHIMAFHLHPFSPHIANKYLVDDVHLICINWPKTFGCLRQNKLDVNGQIDLGYCVQMF